MTSDKPTNPARILYCEGNIDGTIGGSYFSLLYLTKNLNRKRYRPLVVFHKSHGLLEEYKKAGVETKVIPLPSPLVFERPSRSSSIFYQTGYPALRVFQRIVNFIRFMPLLAIKCALFLRKNNVQLLHLNNSIVRNHHWMLAAMISGTKFVTHERGINDDFSRSTRFFAKRINAIICISKAVRNTLKEHNVIASRIQVIYNGIDPTEMQISGNALDLHSEYEIPIDRKLLGVVGNIKQWKGQKTAISAMPRILLAHPDTVCFLIGDVSPGDSQYYAEINDLIDELGIRDNVIFTGYTTEVAKHMNALDIVLHTSIDPEPFGRVLIEAMALRKPLIGADAGAVPEIVDAGTTGLIFSPGDERSLANRVVELLDHPENAKQMGDAGFARLIDRFHVAQNVTQTEKLYEDLLNFDD